MKTVAEKFRAHLAQLAYQSSTETGRYPKYMLDLLTRHDGQGIIEWFKRDLKRKRTSKGFLRMMTASKPHLTAEQVIRDDTTYAVLFDDEDRQQAAARLAAFGF